MGDSAELRSEKAAKIPDASSNHILMKLSLQEGVRILTGADKV